MPAELGRTSERAVYPGVGADRPATGEPRSSAALRRPLNAGSLDIRRKVGPARGKREAATIFAD